MEAAIVVVAEQGVAASTAVIAKRAGVAQGSVFNYFPTKANLLNAMYLDLKSDLNGVVLAELPDVLDTQAQLYHLWVRWIKWGTSNPLRRRALAQLSVSDLISRASREASIEQAATGVGIVRRAIAGGSLKDQSIDFVAALIDALAGVTIDQMLREPETASARRDTVFKALWKAIT